MTTIRRIQRNYLVMAEYNEEGFNVGQWIAASSVEVLRTVMQNGLLDQFQCGFLVQEFFIADFVLVFIVLIEVADFQLISIE